MQAMTESHQTTNLLVKNFLIFIPTAASLMTITSNSIALHSLLGIFSVLTVTSQSTQTSHYIEIMGGYINGT